MKKFQPSIVIHAGAGPKLPSREREKSAHESLKKILRMSYERLMAGEKAVDAVVWAVTQLEDDPQFTAGTGGMLQSDGIARLSCSLMDGEKLRFAGLINIENVKNPIQISKVLMNEKDRVLAAQGAIAYARSKDFTDYDPITPEMFNEWKNRHNQKIGLEQLVGTVGAVCVDTHGHLAAATSTGGKGMEIVGRVSDSATIAGNYSSNQAAVSCTGVGEELVENAIAVRIVTRVDDGKTLAQSFEKTFSEFRSRKGRGGAIGVDVQGNVCVDFTTPCILHAIKTHDREYTYPE